MTPARAFVSWLFLLAVAFANGALRQIAYPATLDDFAARQVSTGTGAIALGLAIWLLLRRWPIASPQGGWATGALWVVLTVAFEAAMVRGGGRPWSEVGAQYAVWKGSLWPLLLLWLLVAPAALSAVQRSNVAAGATVGAAIGGWAACGATFVAARASAGLSAAIVIHLVAAPGIATLATLLLRRHPRHPGPWGTAATLAGTAALLDAVVVAPFLERSFAMFASLLGTWVPLGLMFASSRLAARQADRTRGSEVGPQPTAHVR